MCIPLKRFPAQAIFHSCTAPIREVDRIELKFSAGKLLTTPSHLLKLVIPLTTFDQNSDRKDVEPLSLLVHPQQPLSYLERLIQSELPAIKDNAGQEKIPSIEFWAEETEQSAIQTKYSDDEVEPSYEGDREESKIQDKTGRTGKLTSSDERAEQQGGPISSTVETYSGLGREGSSQGGKEVNLVRWSTSTEIGDFIREAARGVEFAVRIEGSPREIRIGVPSFKDRTHYLRMRFKNISRKISDMAAIKRECDLAAHNSAQRLAIAGGFGLAAYWMAVCSLTFYTDLGWDVMEPVTYLVGLSTLICGYLWFVYHRREVSYQAAMNLTVSRRQSTLYQSKGFNVKRWQNLVDEANHIRREINTVARAYDVEWDELADQNEEVVEALKDGKKSKGKSRDDDGEEDDDD